LGSRNAEVGMNVI